MSFLRWFFGTDRTNAHIGPPGAQGMIVVDPTPPKTTEQVRAEQAALPPRTWTILDGEGHHIGTATENPTTKLIEVTWSHIWLKHATTTRSRWVDFDAFEDDMLAAGDDSFTALSRITAPIRLRFHPRNDTERLAEQMKESFF